MIQGYSTDVFDQWLHRCKDRHGPMRILARVDRLASGNPGDHKSVGQGVTEMRLRWGPGYSVYYAKRGNRIVLLLCGGDKSSQSRDIITARQLASDWPTTKGET